MHKVQGVRLKALGFKPYNRILATKEKDEIFQQG